MRIIFSCCSVDSVRSKSGTICYLTRDHPEDGIFFKFWMVFSSYGSRFSVGVWCWLSPGSFGVSKQQFFCRCKASRCTTEDLAPIIEADSIEQYGRRDFGVQEEPGEDVHAKVVSVAEKAGVQISANDVSACHRLPGGGSGPKPLIAKFTRRATKHQLMKYKRNLKNTNIFVNEWSYPNQS